MTPEQKVAARLRCVSHIIEEELGSGSPILHHTHGVLTQASLALESFKQISSIEISQLYVGETDFSDNPRIRVGAWVLHRRGKYVNGDCTHFRKSQGGTETTIDTIYNALGNIFAIHNTLNTPLDIYIPSFSTLDYLTTDKKSDNERLQRKVESLRGLVHELPVPIYFDWRNENSVAGMQQVAGMLEQARQIWSRQALKKMAEEDEDDTSLRVPDNKAPV